MNKMRNIIRTSDIAPTDTPTANLSGTPPPETVTSISFVLPCTNFPFILC